MESIPTMKHSLHKKISELRASDEKVQVVGLVVDKSESDIVLDDGSGQLPVILEDRNLSSGVEIGSKVRVFGNPMEAEGGIELRAEILQRIDSLDFKLNERVREERKKLEAELGRN